MQHHDMFFVLNDLPLCLALSTVQKAAIKKMDMQATQEFLAELKVLTHVHHLNLVRYSSIFYLNNTVS
jgi:serine/threonine protein kinase